MSAQLSSVLNACGIVLPLVNLRQQTVKDGDTIWNILQSIERNKPDDKHVGSTAEGLELTSSDIDFISVAKCKVWDNISEAVNLSSSGPSFEILRIADITQPGYSKLYILKWGEGLIDYLVLHGENYYLKNNINAKTLSQLQKDYPEKISLHGPALNTRCYPPQDTYSLLREAGNATEINIAISVVDINTDFVACLRGELWPVEAFEWMTRRRSAKWSTQHLFDDIIKSGYYLAGVGSKESKDNEMQWRVSFNKAEQLIVESLNETQIHCIIILKLSSAKLLSDITGKNITSYTIKTVMFWCLEEKSEKLWQSSTLIFFVCFCISKLKSFVEKRFLPNYFIRKRNQFNLSELTRNIQIKIVQCLDSFLKDPTASISLILPTYKVYQNTPRLLLNRISQERLIENWLRLRVFIAQQYHAPGGREFSKLYNGYNINKILLRCHEVLEKLKTVSYAQPFVKILQNCMGVLQYVLLIKDKQTFACTKHSVNRRKYTNFMEFSFAGEVTNTNLRIATCYLDDGVTDDCLKILQTVTGQTINST